MSVGFVTIGRDGQPILDLKPEEVQLRVDCGQRTLKSPPAGAAKDPDRFIISGVFPIAALAAGDYVVRATVGTPE